MLGAVAVGDKRQLALAGPHRLAQLNNLGFRRHAGQREKLVEVVLIRSNHREVAIDLPDALLDLGLGGVDVRKLTLRGGEHVLDRGRLFALAKSLHLFLGQAHFFLKTIPLLQEELGSGLRGVGTPVVDIPDVFVGVGVRQFHREVRIRSGDEHIDEPCLRPEGGNHHSIQRTGHPVDTGIAGGNAGGGKESRILIELQPGRHALCEGIAAEEIDHRVDHVDASNRLVADLLGLNDLGLLLLDEEHGSGTINCLDGGEFVGGENARNHQAQDHQPKAIHDRVEILAPVNGVRGRLNRVFGLKSVFAHPNRFFAGLRGSIPTFAHGDDVSRQNLKTSTFGILKPLGVDFDGFRFAAKHAFDGHIFGIGNSRKSSRHADRLENAKRFVSLKFIAARAHDLPDERDLPLRVGGNVQINLRLDQIVGIEKFSDMILRLTNRHACDSHLPEQRQLHPPVPCDLRAHI